MDYFSVFLRPRGDRPIRLPLNTALESSDYVRCLSQTPRTVCNTEPWYSLVGWRSRMSPCPAAECEIVGRRRRKGRRLPAALDLLFFYRTATYWCPQWAHFCGVTRFIYEVIPLSSAAPRGAPPAVVARRGGNACPGCRQSSHRSLNKMTRC